MEQEEPGKTGVVVGLHISAASGASMRSVDCVRGFAGRGLEGDRYFSGAGTYSNVPEPGRQVTLVETEALDALERVHGIELHPGETRRNIATQGVSLNGLVGREFKVGEVTLRGVEVCEPCSHMAQLAGKNVLRGLVHRGGLRADILTDGLIQVGDPVGPGQ